MEYLSINKARITNVLLIVSLSFLFGCKSTPPEDTESNCTEESTNCPSNQDNGEDRGYNPCLVNKSLPVCKK